jgi:outer membrane receptor protein involved in Fe transport
MKKLNKMLLWGTALASIATGIGAAPMAAAQESGAEEETIVVTARRVEETLIETPAAVTAFDSDALERLQIESVDDVARFTPGLSFSRAFGRTTERPVIRGQSNVLANVQFGVESGTAYFVDGIYYQGSIQSLDLGDIARVEVIRGPQSALYGRNTYAGAINFITRRVGDEFGFRGSARGAEHGELDLRASFEAPLAPNVGLRFAARHYEYDGEFTNIVNGETVGSEETNSFAGSFDWDVTSNLSFRVRGSFNQDRDGPLALFLQPASENNCMVGRRSLAFWANSGSTNNFQYYCGVIQPGQVALNTSPRTNPLVLVPGVPLTATFGFVSGGPYNAGDGTAFDGVERETFLVNTMTSWDMGGSGYTLDFDFGFRDEFEKFGADSDHSGVNVIQGAGQESFFANTSRDDVRDYSYELRLSSPQDQRIRWLLGAYYFDSENEGNDITFADLDGTDSLDDFSTLTNQAIFGMLELDITDTLTLTLEGRDARERKTLQDYNAATGALTFSNSVSFENFTPRATLRWMPSEDLSFYAIYAQGVKPGGLNGSIGAAVGRPTYAQEESENFEIGMHGSFMDSRFLVNFAAYTIEAENVQLTTAIPPLVGTGATTSIVTNQGAGETLGMEIDATWRMTDNLTIGGSYAWTRPEFTEGCDEDQWTLTSGGGLLTDPIACTGTAQVGFVGDGSIVGNRYPLTSEHQASLNFDYRRSTNWGATEFFAQGDVTYESSKFVQVHNLAETGDATLLGGRFGLESENWTIGVFGRNLTDEDSVTMATRWLQTPYFTFLSPTLNSSASGFSRGAPRAFFGSLRRGRTFGVEVRYQY